MKAWEIKINDVVNVPVSSFQLKGVKAVSYEPFKKVSGGAYEKVIVEFYDGTTQTFKGNDEVEVLNI
jgi:glucose-6-phosphate 1-dehydrogenase